MGLKYSRITRISSMETTTTIWATVTPTTTLFTLEIRICIVWTQTAVSTAIATTLAIKLTRNWRLNLLYRQINTNLMLAPKMDTLFFRFKHGQELFSFLSPISIAENKMDYAANSFLFFLSLFVCLISLVYSTSFNNTITSWIKRKKRSQRKF